MRLTKKHLFIAGLLLGPALIILLRSDPREAAELKGPGAHPRKQDTRPHAEEDSADGAKQSARTTLRHAQAATPSAEDRHAPSRHGRIQHEAHRKGTSNGTPESLQSRPVMLGGISGDEALAAYARLSKDSGDNKNSSDNAATPLTPRWKIGEGWRVYTYYRNMSASSPGDHWTGPVVWNYQVSGREVVQGRSAFVLTVTTRSGNDRTPGNVKRPATFYIDAERYTALAYKGWRLVRGELEEVYTLFDKSRPATGGLFSLIPLDLPPAGTTGTLQPSGLPMLDAVTPELAKVIPQPKLWSGAGGAYLTLKFRNGLDRTTTRQRWRSGDNRWPVTSITPTRRSYRLGQDD